MLGSYRFEYELRRKWSDKIRLLLKMLFQRMAGRTTDTNRLRKMAERITDVNCSFRGRCTSITVGLYKRKHRRERCSQNIKSVLRIAVSVFIVPWTILLYLIFSITMGPQTGHELSITLCMHKAITSFVMLGSYRIEYELRRKWSDKIRLLLKMLFQRMAGRTTDTNRLRKMAERFTGVNCSFRGRCTSNDALKRYLRAGKGQTGGFSVLFLLWLTEVTRCL